LVVDPAFKAVGIEPTGARHANVTQAGVSLDYTTVLNAVALLVAAALLTRYFRKGGGIPMLRMLNTPMTEGHNHAHAAY
jgi:hypothetical protein